MSCKHCLDFLEESNRVIEERMLAYERQLANMFGATAPESNLASIPDEEMEGLDDEAQAASDQELASQLADMCLSEAERTEAVEE
jgi:hypothetical protein